MTESKEQDITATNKRYDDCNIKYEELPYREPLIWVPRRNLFGTQTRTEYRGSRLKLITQSLKMYGTSFLLYDPVIACVLPENQFLRIAILDGHHRTRAAGSAGIEDIPCKVFTPETLSEAIRSHYKLDLPPERLENDISMDTYIANFSFNFCQKDTNKKPQLVPLACILNPQPYYLQAS